MRPRLGRSLGLALLLAAAATAAGPQAANEAAFLVLKTGERDATQKKAGKFVASLGRYLAPALSLTQLEGLVTNKPEEAVSLVEKRHPVFGIVTPAFFLENEERMGLVAVAETRRLGKDGEAFSILVKKGGTSPAAGAVLATSLLGERGYVERVILPGMSPAAPERLELRSSRNLADAVYDLLEGGPKAPAAVLVDGATLEFFRADEQVGPRLDVLAVTGPLPADLVVVFDAANAGDRAQRLWSSLEKILGDDEGRKICQTLQTDGFAKVAAERLAQTRARFRAGK